MEVARRPFSAILLTANLFSCTLLSTWCFGLVSVGSRGIAGRGGGPVAGVSVGVSRRLGRQKQFPGRVKGVGLWPRVR